MSLSYLMAEPGMPESKVTLLAPTKEGITNEK